MLGHLGKCQTNFMRVSNACNTDFCLFVVLGDEINALHFAQCYLGHVYKGK